MRYDAAMRIQVARLLVLLLGFATIGYGATRPRDVRTQDPLRPGEFLDPGSPPVSPGEAACRAGRTASKVGLSALGLFLVALAAWPRRAQCLATCWVDGI